MGGRLEAVHVSRGGVPKTAVLEATITPDGLAGDRQRNRRYHGGPDRAVVLFSLDRISALQGEGHPIAAGATGENLTLSHLDWTLLVPGIEVEIGDVRLRITSYVEPCRQIASCFADRAFRRIDQDRHPGWSRVAARVITPGVVRPGDPVTLVPR